MSNEPQPLFKLSSGTSNKIDWSRITDTIRLTLDELGVDRGSSTTERAGLGEVRVDPALVREAFSHVESEFQRVLKPLRAQMKIVSGLVLVSIAVAIAGAALASVTPWVRGVMSLGGISALFGLLFKAWQLSRDQAMLELIPARYRLALQFATAPREVKQILSQFLAETSSIRKK